MAGPLLFQADMIDLTEIITCSSSVRQFAEVIAISLVLIFTNESITFQNDLSLLQKWELELDIEFNPNKCEVIQVT